MPGQNRLSELYSGEIGERAEQQRCKDRINWLSKHVRGNRILDVGCSQGIASLLMGRSGMEVTGVDLDQEAIDFALNQLQEEKRDVRERVHFQTADAVQIPYPDDHFDSALVGNILEWVADPNAILSELTRVLKPESPIAVSVTLSSESESGHHQTYLLMGFLELIEKYFSVMDIKFSQDSLLACLENKRPDESARSGSARFQGWVKDFEQEYLKDWSKAQEQLTKLDDRHSELQRSLQTLKDEKDVLKASALVETEQLINKIETLQSTAESEHSRADELEIQIQAAQSKNEKLSKDLTLSESKLSQEHESNRTKKESFTQLTADLKDERDRYQLAQKNFTSRQEESAELKQTVVRLETELLATNHHTLRVEKELTEHRTSSATLRSSADQLQTRFHETESALRLSQRDLENLRETSSELSRSQSALQGKYEEFQSRHKESLTDLHAQQDTVRSLEREVARAEHERDRLTDQLRVLSADFKNERHLARETLEERQSLQIEAASLRSEIAFLREVHVENLSRLESTEEENRQSSQDLTSARDQLREVEFDQKETQRSTQLERESLEQRVNEIGGELSTSESALASLRNEHERGVKRGEKQILALSQKLEQADSAWKRQRAALRESLTGSRSLKNELGAANQALAEIQEKVDAVESRRLALEQERVTLAGRLSVSESETANAHTRHTAIVSDLEQKAAEIDIKRDQIERELGEKRDYLDRLQELFKKEQANHKKVYASLQRHTESWKRRGHELALAKSNADSTGRRLQQVEAELAQLKSAFSFRVATKVNGILHRFHLQRKAKQKAPRAKPLTASPDPKESSSPSLISMASNLPTPSPDRSRTRNGANLPRTAAILDEFSMACFAPDCEMVTFRTDNWREKLEADKPELLLVESAWHGNDDSWQYRVASYEKNMGDELVDVIDWCKSQSIPTVFWNKEDPVHYDRFIDSARHFDVILTSDARCTEQYEKEVGHRRIHALPFAAQPEIHNPVRAEKRSGQVCFAGSYYANRFEQRREDMDNILKPALEYGLDIFDRNHGLVIPGTDHFRFPDIYQPAIRGRLEYDEMIEAYKRYRVFLNVNSVKTSRTMFSRRVFELLACGTPVISTPSVGISELLGDELVVRAESEQETRSALERLLNNDGEWARISALGIRKVLSEHTYKARFDSVLEFAGLGRRDPPPERIIFVARPETQSELEALAETILKQTRRPDVLFLLESRSIRKKWLRVATEKLEQNKIEIKNLNQAAFRNSVEKCDPNAIMTFLSCQDAYGPQYMADHLQAFIYSPTAVLGKASHFELKQSSGSAELRREEDEHHIVDTVPSGTVCARRGSLNSKQIEELVYSGRADFEHSEIYAGHRFNYCRTLSGTKPGQLPSSLTETIYV